MKTYFNPTTESVEIEAILALCDGSNPDNNNVSNEPDPLGGAPRRQVF